jgi:hypothetical protein
MSAIAPFAWQWESAVLVTCSAHKISPYRDSHTHTLRLGVGLLANNVVWTRRPATLSPRNKVLLREPTVDKLIKIHYRVHKTPATGLSPKPAESSQHDPTCPYYHCRQVVLHCGAATPIRSRKKSLYSRLLVEPSVRNDASPTSATRRYIYVESQPVSSAQLFQLTFCPAHYILILTRVVAAAATAAVVVIHQ